MDVVNEIKSKSTWSYKQVLELFEKANLVVTEPEVIKATKKVKVEKIKRYDVLYLSTFGSMHYVLVHKVKGEVVYGVIITSTPGLHTLFEVKENRKFKGSHIGSPYTAFPLEDCLKAFHAVWECRLEANAIFKSVKNYYRENL